MLRKKLSKSAANKSDFAQGSPSQSGAFLIEQLASYFKNIRTYILAIPSYLIAYGISSVFVVGFCVGALFTSDTRWMEWHISRLGEGGQLPAFIFNISIIIAAVLLIIFTHILIHDMEQLDTPIDNTKTAIIKWSFIVTAVSWMGLALFPFDRFPVTHNIFGYSMFIVLGCIMIAFPWLANLPQHVMRFGQTSAIVVALAMIAFHVGKVGTLLAVELLGGILLLAWLILLARATHRHTLR